MKITLRDLLLAAVAIVATPAATYGYNSVLIHNYDGSDHRIAIDGDSLTISLNGRAIRLSNSGITVEYDIPEVKHFAFENYQFPGNEYYVGTKADLTTIVEPVHFTLAVMPPDGAELRAEEPLTAISFAHADGLNTKVAGQGTITLTRDGESVMEWNESLLAEAYDAETRVYTFGNLNISTPGAYVIDFPPYLISEDEQPINLNMAHSSTFVVKEQENALKQVSTPTITFRKDGGRLLVGGLVGSGRVRLLSVSGSEVASAPVTPFGTATIEVDRLRHGAYLLMTDGKIFKISF